MATVQCPMSTVGVRAGLCIRMPTVRGLLGWSGDALTEPDMITHESIFMPHFVFAVVYFVFCSVCYPTIDLRLECLTFNAPTYIIKSEIDFCTDEILYCFSARIEVNNYYDACRCLAADRENCIALRMVCCFVCRNVPSDQCRFSGWISYRRAGLCIASHKCCFHCLFAVCFEYMYTSICKKRWDSIPCPADWATCACSAISPRM